jgi:hypothetical protein
MALKPLIRPGGDCQSDPRGRKPRQAGPLHRIEDPAQDADLLRVEAWLNTQPRPLASILGVAVADAIHYVLDGARTGRYDLWDPEVDSDERRSVGTKLQYRVLGLLGLEKLKPLDTMIGGVAVDIKGTIGKNWTIPKEAQCEICLLVQVDARRDLHRAFLIRAHRAWLNDGKNDDSKRSFAKLAFEAYARPQYDWAPLAPNPLKALTRAQHAEVFAPYVGQERRLTALFGHLSNVVIPRWAILTVCANRDDPMRRARAIKELVMRRHGLTVLCGKWAADREEAEASGIDLSGSAWIAYQGPAGL